jgi:hypothetical protein
MSVISLLASVLLAVGLATLAQVTIGLMLAAAASRLFGQFAFYVVIIATGYASGGLGAYVYKRLRPAATRSSTMIVGALSLFAAFLGVVAAFVAVFMRGGPKEF